MKIRVAHPEANAVSERINTSIKSTIKSLMAEGYTFENATKIHENIYNSSFHYTIQSTPNKIHFGRELANVTETLKLRIHQHRYRLLHPDEQPEEIMTKSTII